MRQTMVVIFSILAGSTAMTASAQEAGQQTAPANTPYIAPTGKTVPRPSDLPNGGGVGRDPQSRTDEERRVDKITGGICNGC